MLQACHVSACACVCVRVCARACGILFDAQVVRVGRKQPGERSLLRAARHTAYTNCADRLGMILSQVLEPALLRYQKGRGGADKLSVRRLQLFGYVSLVDDSGCDRGRVHATNFWQSGKRFEHGKFNTIRIRIGDEDKPEFALLMLVFRVTLTDAEGEDYQPECLVLVRKFDREVVRQSASGQTWRETRLKWPSGDRGFYVQPLHTVVDAWHLAPDVNHAPNSGRFIANDFVFSFISTKDSQDVAEGDAATTGATGCGLSSAAQTQPEEQAIGTFKSPNSGTYAQWVAVTEPPPAAQFKRGLHLSKQPRRNVVAHRSDTLGWRIGVLTGRVSKKPRSPKDKPIAGLYKVVYPDMPALETYDLLPTSYGVNSRWVFLQQPGALC